MRLFIAINLSDEMKNSVIQTMHQLKKAGVSGRYVPKQNLHLTLAFIGEREDYRDVVAAMEGLTFKPFRLSLSSLGNFGDLLWMGLKGNQGLSRLVRDLRASLKEGSIPYDNKKILPHITIIRKMKGKWQQVAVPGKEMMVRRISLMKSEVRDGKRVYKEIFSLESK